MPDTYDEALSHDLQALKAKTIAEHGEAAWAVVEKAMGMEPTRRKPPPVRVGVKPRRRAAIPHTTGAGPSWRDLSDLSKISPPTIRRTFTVRTKFGIRCDHCSIVVSKGQGMAVLSGDTIRNRVCVSCAKEVTGRA